MTDRELLELAAKAAGLVVIADARERGLWIADFEDEWNPLTDDGDALRLAVRLDMTICIVLGKVTVAELGRTPKHAKETHGDPYSATRRAIVRAAAEIGKTIDD